MAFRVEEVVAFVHKIVFVVEEIEILQEGGVRTTRKEEREPDAYFECLTQEEAVHLIFGPSFIDLRDGSEATFSAAESLQTLHNLFADVQVVAISGCVVEIPDQEDKERERQSHEPEVKS